MKTHRGKFFIIPNLACLITNDDSYPQGMSRYGFSIAVEVWMISDNCDNWHCHGGPLHASCLPLDLIADMKEGDVLTFESKDSDNETALFELEACQSEFRYRRFGAFEEALHHVTSRPGYPYFWKAHEEHVVAIWKAEVESAFNGTHPEQVRARRDAEEKRKAATS